MPDLGKNFDDAVGKAKDKVGEAVGDESLQAEGKKDQAKAEMKDVADKAKDKAGEAINKLRDTLH